MHVPQAVTLHSAALKPTTTGSDLLDSFSKDAIQPDSITLLKNRPVVARSVRCHQRTQARKVSSAHLPNVQSEISQGTTYQETEPQSIESPGPEPQVVIDSRTSQQQNSFQNL